MQRLYPLSFAAAMFGIALSSSAALAQAYPPGPPHPPGPPPGPPGHNHPPPPHPPGPPAHVVVINHPAPPPTHVVVINRPPPPTHVVVINRPPPPTHVVVVNHPPGPQPGNWHQWHNGDHYDGDRHYVSNWNSYHLRQPPAGYQWVQDGSQFVLIAVASGIIADVVLNAAYQ